MLICAILILSGLSKEEKKISLKVNPSQCAMLKQEIPEVITSMGFEAVVSILPDENVMEGGCVVTTSNGVIDATIESQLSIIENYITELIENPIVNIEYCIPATKCTRCGKDIPEVVVPSQQLLFTRHQLARLVTI